MRNILILGLGFLPMFAFAGIQFDEYSMAPSPSLSALKDHTAFCDTNSKLWEAVKDHLRVYGKGTYRLIGTETNLFQVVAVDQATHEIRAFVDSTSPLLITQIGAANYPHGFSFELHANDICLANPGKVFTGDEFFKYLESLQISYKALAQ